MFFDFFEKIDKNQLSIGLDKYLKDLFKNTVSPSEFMTELLSIQK